MPRPRINSTRKAAAPTSQGKRAVLAGSTGRVTAGVGVFVGSNFRLSVVGVGGRGVFATTVGTGSSITAVVGNIRVWVGIGLLVGSGLVGTAVGCCVRTKKSGSEPLKSAKLTEFP